MEAEQNIPPQGGVEVPVQVVIDSLTQQIAAQALELAKKDGIIKVMETQIQEIRMDLSMASARLMELTPDAPEPEPVREGEPVG